MAISDVCKYQVKKEIDECVSKGMSRNAAAKWLADILTEQTGREINPETIRKQDQRVRNELGTNVPTEEKPKCKKCGARYAIKAHGLCRSCRRIELQKERWEKGKAEFDKLPADSESEKFWLKFVDTVYKHFNGNVQTGKVSKGVWKKVTGAMMEINQHLNQLTKSSVFMLR